MKTVKALMLGCVVGVSLGLAGVPSAKAIEFDFTTPSGPLGTTQNYTVDGFTINASGFSNAAALATSPIGNVNLFGKVFGGSEDGLGLLNDPTPNEFEIQGTSLIRIAFAAGLTNVTFQMDSVTGGDAWEVWGSTSATALGTPIATGNDQQVSHALPLFPFYNFAVQAFSPTSGNVLLRSISAVPVPGPIVGAGLPGLLVACGGLIALARRRRRPVV